MRSRWAASVGLAAMLVVLASCSSSSSPVFNPTPVLTGLFPDHTTALGLPDCTKGSSFMLNVSGTSFISSSQAQWNGSNRTTTFNAVTQQLAVTIQPCDIESPGTAEVTVSNPAPGGGVSSSLTFFINGPNNAQPTISSLSPQNAPFGGPSFSLLVTGNNFLAISSVAWNGSPRVTAFNPGTGQLTATILSQDILCPGTANVTVTNPAPGGGTSLGSPFAIEPSNSQLPCILALSPASASAGGAGFQLVVTGTNFNSTSTVAFNGNTRVTTFNSSTEQLTATILMQDIATAGTASVTVTNTAPAAGTSASFTFTIN